MAMVAALASAPSVVPAAALGRWRLLCNVDLELAKREVAVPARPYEDRHKRQVIARAAPDHEWTEACRHGRRLRPAAAHVDRVGIADAGSEPHLVWREPRSVNVLVGAIVDGNIADARACRHRDGDPLRILQGGPAEDEG